jgi:hypothetical protein
MIRPGMHLNAVGGDCPGKTELHVDILHRARIMVEYAPQSRIEGEIQQWPEAPVSELWQVLSGAVPGRVSADDVTIFDSVGSRWKTTRRCVGSMRRPSRITRASSSSSWHCRQIRVISTDG